MESKAAVQRAAFGRGKRLLEAETGLVYRQKLAMGLCQSSPAPQCKFLLQLKGNQRNQRDNLARAQGSGSRNTEHPGSRLRVTFLRAGVMASFQPPQGSRILEPSLSSATGEEPVEYKSLQWFGATVRAHGSSILVRHQWVLGG